MNQPPDERALEEVLSRPTPDVVQAVAALGGDLVILGAAGKMGPSLARLARRAMDQAGGGGRVIAVSRFTEPETAVALERDGIVVHPCDLFDPAQVAGLPDAPNVIYMAGQKFGTTGDAARTWAVNAVLPAIAAVRYARARVVAFSTG